MSVIVITIEGKDALLIGLNQSVHRVRNWQPIFEKIEEAALGYFRGRFENAGPGWPPLATSTEAQKARLGFGPSRILIRSGALYGSFVKGATANISRIGPQAAEFGSSIPYGVYHQEGAGVPERTIIEVTVDQEERYEEIALNELTEAATSLGFEVKAA
ncbi:MAG TPA: hypothetical protein VF290_22185 [Pyrinomonadaceae bacterium]